MNQGKAYYLRFKRTIRVSVIDSNYTRRWRIALYRW